MNLRMQCRGTFGKTFMSCSVPTDDTCQAEVEEKRNFSALWRLSGRCRTGGPGSPQRMRETEKSERVNCGDTSDKQILTVIILMLLDDDEFRRETNYAFSDNHLFFCNMQMNSPLHVLPFVWNRREKWSSQWRWRGGLIQIRQASRTPQTMQVVSLVNHNQESVKDHVIGKRRNRSHEKNVSNNVEHLGRNWL